jgi:hypothetical protein
VCWMVLGLVLFVGCWTVCRLATFRISGMKETTQGGNVGGVVKREEGGGRRKEGGGRRQEGGRTR